METEMKMMIALKFDINLPISYIFLRRYGAMMQFTMPQVRYLFLFSIVLQL